MVINSQALNDINTETVNINELCDSLILNQLANIRSNINLQEGDSNSNQAADTSPPVMESYCHAFYRILGLPVISNDKTSFYNPGFYGNNITDEEKNKRKTIDSNQDAKLMQVEAFREMYCHQNLLVFNNSALKLQYRLEMMAYPIESLMMDPSSPTAFDIDKMQMEPNLKGRVLFKTVAKFLRPFKCSSFITNKINPSKNKIAAPFVLANDAKVLNTSLTFSYLEFTCRSRFNFVQVKDTELFTNIKAQLIGANIIDPFTNFLDQLTSVENYIFLQLFRSFISICQQVKQSKIDNKKLAAKILAETSFTVGANEQGSYEQETIKFDSIEDQIRNFKEKIAEKQLIYAQIPTDSQYTDGIQSGNKLNCLLNKTFISLIEGDIKKLQSKLKELEQKRNDNVRLFNSISKESFYILGEVNGIGLLDMIALMMSFWLLPQDQLLSMLDNESFNRLYLNTALRNSFVESRNASKKASHDISIVINSMDKIVLSLLMIASEIINSGTTTS